MAKSDFRRSTMSRVSLVDTVLNDCDMREVVLFRADMRGAQLNNVLMRRSMMEAAVRHKNENLLLCWIDSMM